MFGLKVVAAVLALSTAVPSAGSSPSAALPDDARVKDAFERLNDMRPADGIRVLTAPWIEAMKAASKGPQERQRAARYIMLIGYGFMLDSNYKSRLQCAALARALAPNDPDVIAYNIDSLVRHCKTPEATALVRQYDRLSEENAYLARAISNYYRSIGSADKADEYLRTAIALNPSVPAPYVMQARATTDSAQAAKLYAKAAALCAPGSYAREFWLWSADSSEAKANKHPAKLEHLTAAAKLKPDEPSWMIASAWQRLAENNREEALRTFNKAAQTPRFSLRAVEQFAVYCAFTPGGRLSAVAEKAADSIVARQPELPDAYFCRGHVMNAIGKPSEGEKTFLIAQKLAPHAHLPYDNLREYPAYHRGPKKDWLAKTWLESCPEQIEPWLYAAHLDIEQQRWQDALAKYQQAKVRMDSARRTPQKNPRTYEKWNSGMATVSYNLGKQAEAVDFAKSFNKFKLINDAEIIHVRLSHIDTGKLPPGSKAAQAAEHGLLADALYERAQLDDCIKEYRKAIALADNPEWHKGLLKAYMDKQDYISAAGEDIVVSNNTVTHDLPTVLDKFRKTLSH